MAYVYPIDDEGAYGDKLVDAFDAWREAERALDKTPDVLPEDGTAIDFKTYGPGERVVDGEVRYSAAWLDEVSA